MHHRGTEDHRRMNPRALQPATTHRRNTGLGLCAAMLTLLSLAPLRAGGAMALEKLENFPRSSVQIRTQDSAEWFSVWIADTPAREEQGLMFLQWLAPDQGMLFPQEPPRVMSMWMKNTLIPLDMLFIDVHGRITYIKANATPQSEDIITNPAPVRAVLELAGGEAAKRGIRVGDSVRHQLFGSAPAGPVRN
jgi:uncharacterized membrane protein (UPF0127 family)